MRVDFTALTGLGSLAYTTPPVTRFGDLVEGSSFLDQEGNCWTKISPCRARDQRTHESDLFQSTDEVIA